MKRKNFPGRKNMRRVNALPRLVDASDTRKAKGWGVSPGLKDAVSNTSTNIVEQGVALSTKTKKRRN